MVKILNGRKIADKRAILIKKKVVELGYSPKLVIVQVGERADSKSYVASKIKYAKLIDCIAEVAYFPDTVSEDELLFALANLNLNKEVNGIIVQLPLPNNLDEKKIIDAIAENKDVDGLSDYNINKLFANLAGIIPATPRGILTLLRENDLEVAGKHVVVLGRSRLVGKSVSLLMLNHNATVTICHSHTNNLPEITKMADILIVAIGKQKFITKEYVRDGQVIIDVGIGTNGDNKLVGDVDFESIKNMNVSLTPVPGGIGPMTVTSLFENLLEVASNKS